MTSRTLTVDARAQREAMPDVATIEVTVRGDGESAEAARAIARDQAATIRESVTGVESVQIRTVNVEIDESAEMFEPNTEEPYLAQERFHIACAPETVEAVVVAVTDAGGSIQSVEFNLNEQVRRELEDEAQVAAIRRAREKAATMANAEGLSVGEVQSITTTEGDPGMSGLVDLALSEPDCDIAPTPIGISEAVEVVYELTPE